jgi:hypothetical protein
MNKQVLLLILMSVIFLSCNKKDNKTTEFLNQYDKIRLLSYNTHRDVYGSKYELKIEDDTVQVPNIKYVDNVVLNEKFSRKIAEVLLATENECVLADCYNPRHIILFYKANKIIDFYEFCAECGGSTSSKNIKFPALCTGKGDRLIEIFKELKLENDGEETENYKYF